VIDAEAERVAILAPGSRNVELHRSASRVGRVIDLAPNLESEAVAALEGAARANGLIHDDGPHAVATAIAGGLRWGREHPRELPSEGRHAPAVDLDAPDPSDVRTTARATLAHLPAIVASLDLHPGRRPTVFRVLREFLETVAETGCPVVVENLRETARDADVAVGSIVAKRFIDHETGETRERQALAADLGPLGWRWQPGLPDDGTGRARASRWSWAPPGGFTELGERAP
jgi:hypothetical protein